MRISLYAMKVDTVLDMLLMKFSMFRIHTHTIHSYTHHTFRVHRLHVKTSADNHLMQDRILNMEHAGHDTLCLRVIATATSGQHRTGTERGNPTV